ncbi:MAG: hypothetical protein PHS06_03135 [Candidatus Shapirobacteria bacterium]|nr:hypothetical protein [Candidatus Shapirobacteria bacterium]
MTNNIEKFNSPLKEFVIKTIKLKTHDGVKNRLAKKNLQNTNNPIPETPSNKK